MKPFMTICLVSVALTTQANANFVEKQYRAKLPLTEKADKAFLQTLPQNPTPKLADFTETISGNPTVEDGDTLSYGGTRVWLFGIDAPENHHKCHDRKKQQIKGGEIARTALKALIAGQNVTCRYKKDHFRGKFIVKGNIGTFEKIPVNWGICSTPNHSNLSLEMIKTGWVYFALPYKQFYATTVRPIFNLPSGAFAVIKRDHHRNNRGFHNDGGRSICPNPKWDRGDPRP